MEDMDITELENQLVESWLVKRNRKVKRILKKVGRKL